jgi:hypothetical protein
MSNLVIDSIFFAARVVLLTAPQTLVYKLNVRYNK